MSEQTSVDHESYATFGSVFNDVRWCNYDVLSRRSNGSL